MNGSSQGTQSTLNLISGTGIIRPAQTIQALTEWTARRRWTRRTRPRGPWIRPEPTIASSRPAAARELLLWPMAAPRSPPTHRTRLEFHRLRPCLRGGRLRSISTCRADSHQENDRRIAGAHFSRRLRSERSDPTTGVRQSGECVRVESRWFTSDGLGIKPDRAVGIAGDCDAGVRHHRRELSRHILPGSEWPCTTGSDTVSLSFNWTDGTNARVLSTQPNLRDHPKHGWLHGWNIAHLSRER